MIRNDDPLLTPEEAAAYLHVSPGTFGNQRRAGHGPRFHRIGRLVRYKASDLDAYLDSLAVETYDTAGAA